MDKQPLSEREPLLEEFSSLAEAGAFWDTHSTAEYEDVMEDVAFAINLTEKPTYDFTIAKNPMGEVQSAWEAKPDLLHRARRGDWSRFQAILDKVPNNEPDEADRL